MAAVLRLLPGSDDLAPILSVSGEHDMLLAHVVRSLSAAPDMVPWWQHRQCRPASRRHATYKCCVT
jgi:hypothetical protein